MKIPEDSVSLRLHEEPRAPAAVVAMPNACFLDFVAMTSCGHHQEVGGHREVRRKAWKGRKRQFRSH